MGGGPKSKAGSAPAVDESGARVEIVSDDVSFKRYAVVFDRVVKYPNGDVIKFDVWSKNWRNDNEFCQVIPYFSETNTVTMIREYFPAHHQFMYGFPGGNVEEKHGSPLAAIQAELEEEAHLRGGRWLALLDEGASIAQDKYQQDRIYMYVVIDPEKTAAPSEIDQEELITIEEHVPLERVYSLIGQGKFQSNGVSTFLLAMHKLRSMGYKMQ